MYSEYIESIGQIFKIKRSGVVVGSFKGLETPESNGRIGYIDEVDIQIGDHLVNPNGKQFLVQNIVGPLGPYNIRSIVYSSH